MRPLYDINVPTLLYEGQWHLPYIDLKPCSQGTEDWQYYSSGSIIMLEDAKKISASMCAQVSYRKANDSLEKALLIYDRLIHSTPAHSSPFEHQASALADPEERSGNFRGWHQYRQDLPNNVCNVYQKKAA